MIVLAPGDPLRPDPDQAREWLREELAKPDYQRPLLERLLGWFNERLDDITSVASGASQLSALAAIVLAVALVGLLLYVAPRVRRERTVRRGDRGPLLEEDVTATELRARAEQALADGRLEDAAVDGYRALATRMVERGTLDATPGSTAHELATRLAARFPAQASGLVTAADLFDAVLYGDHPASREDARSVLALDDVLQRTRPVDPVAAVPPLVVPR